MGKFSQIIESATDFLSGNDNFPWSTPDDIIDLKKEHAEAKEDKSKYRIEKSTMRLSCALVYSRQPNERQQGIDMLAASLINTDDLCQRQDILCLLALGYYRSGDYPMSMHFLDQCLKIEPNCKEALSLKKTVEEYCAKDSWTGIGITVGGIVAAGGIAAFCGTGVVGGMTAVVARRGLVVAAGAIVAACGIVTANRMAASATSPHQN